MLNLVTIINKSKVYVALAAAGARVAALVNRYMKNNPKDDAERESFEKLDDFLTHVLAKRVRRTFHVVKETV